MQQAAPQPETFDLATMVADLNSLLRLKRTVIGLAPQDEKWLAGQNYVGVWHGTAEDAAKRQQALDVVPHGRYEALVVSPLASGRLNPPDICLVYATPGQMIILINGLQYTGYKKFEWGVVGE